MKTKNFKLLSMLFAATCVLIFSCKKEEEKKDETPVDTTPTAAMLFPGRFHMFKVIQKNLTTGQDTTINNALQMTTTSDLGSGKFRVITSSAFPTDTMVIKKDKDGIWQEDSTNSNTFHQVVKSNPVKDEIYMSYEKIGSRIDTVYRKVTNVSTGVSTDSLGTFTCVEIKEYTGKANIDKDYSVDYIDLKTGMIKFEGYKLLYGGKYYTYILTKKNY